MRRGARGSRHSPLILASRHLSPHSPLALAPPICLSHLASYSRPSHLKSLSRPDDDRSTPRRRTLIVLRRDLPRIVVYLHSSDRRWRRRSVQVRERVACRRTRPVHEELRAVEVIVRDAFYASRP